jgi:hypothetical protein
MRFFMAAFRADAVAARTGSPAAAHAAASLALTPAEPSSSARAACRFSFIHDVLLFDWRAFCVSASELNRCKSDPFI